jgi:hypothetical protein
MEEDNHNHESPKADKYTEARVKKGIETLLNEKELKIKWRKELEDNPEVVAYFDTFRGNAMEDFLNYYISQKYFYHTYGDFYKKLSEKKRNQWIDEAYEQLEAILQKQLFDKQCLWRAGQITLEGVEIIFDFTIWSQDIFNCPFLDTISSSDIALYQSFLADEGLSRYDLNGFNEWQDYDQYKKSYTSSEDNDYLTLPEWYEFHNNRTGNGTLLLMNDARGKKEQLYKELHRDSKDKEQDNPIIQPQVEVDSRPYIRTHCNEQTALFIDKFESKTIKNQYKYYHEMTDSRINSNTAKLLDEIIDAGEQIPVSSHHDILEAIEIAYNRYVLKNIAAHLPMAHEIYLFNKQMQINSTKVVEPFYYEFREKYKEKILKGRELNGEPRNFDF